MRMYGPPMNEMCGEFSNVQQDVPGQQVDGAALQRAFAEQSARQHAAAYGYPSPQQQHEASLRAAALDAALRDGGPNNAAVERAEAYLKFLQG